jgi:hypothetical protein
MKIPDLHLLRESLFYDSKTGIFKWLLSRGTQMAGSTAGSVKQDGYIVIGFEGKLYFAHRMAWFFHYGEWPEFRIDHEDNVPSHNWISNLRPAEHSENMANRKLNRNNVSGFKGVCLRDDGRYRAYLNHKKVRYHLGDFLSAEEAHVARKIKALELHGCFAREF